MADNKLHLKIITHESVLVDEMVDAVYSKSVDGLFGVMPGHIPFMTALDIGVTKYNQAGKEEFIAVIGGIFQVTGNDITILSDVAERGENIDLPRARAAEERAVTRLRAAAKDIDTARAEIALARAMARIQAATKIRNF